MGASPTASSCGYGLADRWPCCAGRSNGVHFCDDDVSSYDRRWRWRFLPRAGPRDAPTIVLLHGFPSSSREFDTLIPLLATRYHLVAADFPGFGQSDAPPAYTYTLNNLAKTTNDMLEQLKTNKYVFYLHDYGRPIGFRIISTHPERVQALIIQNANAIRKVWAPSGPVHAMLGRSKSAS
jgi:pimeloyl-ACP methyl ester carboxylesterase